MRPTDDVQAAGTTAGVQLQWAPASDAALKGYNVYRSSSANGTYSLVNSAPITGTSFLDTAVSPGAVNYYKVSAVDASGESKGTGAAALAVPAAPTNLTAAASTAGVIKLTWSAPTGARR